MTVHRVGLREGFLFLLCFLAPAAAAQPVQDVTYSNSAGQYSLRYPADWQVRERGSQVHLFLPLSQAAGDQRMVIKVSTSPVVTGMSFPWLRSHLVKRHRAGYSGEFLVLEEGFVRLDGRKALKLVYRGEIGDASTTAELYGLWAGGSIYEIQMMGPTKAYRHQAPLARRVVRSFTLFLGKP